MSAVKKHFIRLAHNTQGADGLSNGFVAVLRTESTEGTHTRRMRKDEFLEWCDNGSGPLRALAIQAYLHPKGDYNTYYQTEFSYDSASRFVFSHKKFYAFAVDEGAPGRGALFDESVLRAVKCGVEELNTQLAEIVTTIVRRVSALKSITVPRVMCRFVVDEIGTPWLVSARVIVIPRRRIDPPKAPKLKSSHPPPWARSDDNPESHKNAGDCAGDYCGFIHQTKDTIMSAFQEEMDAQRRKQRRPRRVEARQPKASAASYVVSKKSIILARIERRASEQTEAGTVVALTGTMAQLAPSDYYREAMVCAHCFRYYAALDAARDRRFRVANPGLPEPVVQKALYTGEPSPPAAKVVEKAPSPPAAKVVEKVKPVKKKLVVEASSSDSPKSRRRTSAFAPVDSNGASPPFLIGATKGKDLFMRYDADTVISYTVLGTAKEEEVSPHFVVVSDIFDTFHTYVPAFQKLVSQHPGTFALLVNFPGAASTEWSAPATNELISTILVTLLSLLQESNAFPKNAPICVVGFGINGSAAVLLPLKFPHITVHSIVLVNSHSWMDPSLRTVLESWRAAIDADVEGGHDHFFSFFGHMFHSRQYLESHSVPKALPNGITPEGRQCQIRGALKGTDFGNMLAQVKPTVIYMRSGDDSIVGPRHVELWQEMCETAPSLLAVLEGRGKFFAMHYPGVGHNLLVESEAELLAMLNEVVKISL